MKIVEKVSEILKELSGIDKIKPEDTLQNDLALDSLCMVILLVEIEDAFEIQLNESDMNPYELNTVQDIIGLINKYLGEYNE